MKKLLGLSLGIFMLFALVSGCAKKPPAPPQQQPTAPAGTVAPTTPSANK